MRAGDPVCQRIPQDRKRGEAFRSSPLLFCPGSGGLFLFQIGHQLQSRLGPGAHVQLDGRILIGQGVDGFNGKRLFRVEDEADSAGLVDVLHELGRVVRPFGGAEVFLDILLGRIHALFGGQAHELLAEDAEAGQEPFISVSRFDVAELDVLFNKVFNVGIGDAVIVDDLKEGLIGDFALDGEVGRTELGDAEGSGAVELVVLVGQGHGIGCAGIYFRHAHDREQLEFRHEGHGHLEVLQRHFKGVGGGRRVRDVQLVQRNIEQGAAGFEVLQGKEADERLGPGEKVLEDRSLTEKQGSPCILGAITSTGECRGKGVPMTSSSPHSTTERMQNEY